MICVALRDKMNNVNTFFFNKKCLFLTGANFILFLFFIAVFIFIFVFIAVYLCLITIHACNNQIIISNVQSVVRAKESLYQKALCTLGSPAHFPKPFQ